MSYFFKNRILSIMENKYITLNEFNLKKLNSDYDSDTDFDKNCDIYSNSIVVTKIDLGSENLQYIFYYVVSMVSCELANDNKIIINNIRDAIISNNYKKYKYEFVFFVMSLLIDYIKKNFEEKKYSIYNSIDLKKLLLAKKFLKNKLFM